MKTQRSIGIVSLVAVSFPVLVSNVGCASIMSGSTQLIQFTTNPDGAQIEIVSNRGRVLKRFEAPNSVELKRGRGFFAGADISIRVQAAGHAQKEVKIPMHLNGWYWGNILFGGPLGLLIVDPITGAMFTFPEHMHIDLDGEDKISWSRQAALNTKSVDPVRSVYPKDKQPARETELPPPSHVFALVD